MLCVLAKHWFDRTTLEIPFGTFVQRPAIDRQRLADGLDCSVYILLGMRIANDEGRCDYAALDHFLHEQGPKRLAWSFFRIPRSEQQIAVAAYYIDVA